MRDEGGRAERYAWAGMVRMRMHQKGIIGMVRDGMKSKRDRKDDSGWNRVKTAKKVMVRDGMGVEVIVRDGMGIEVTVRDGMQHKRKKKVW